MTLTTVNTIASLATQSKNILFSNKKIMKLDKENKIDLEFNEVVGSNHVTIACDVLPTLRQGAKTIKAHKLIDDDDARINPIDGKLLQHFYA